MDLRDLSHLFVFDERMAQMGFTFRPLRPDQWEIKLNENKRQVTRDERLPYQKDAHKVMASLFLIRLQNVSQVDHPTAFMELGRNNPDAWNKQYYNSRLTHTFQVARLARQIATRFTQKETCEENWEAVQKYNGVYPDVAEAAALAHDIGHPPFGHVCEKNLARLMHDKGGFEGNAQTLRILTLLSPGKSPGVNITRRTLAACLKYPWTHSERRDESNHKCSLYDLPNALTPNEPSKEQQLLSWIYESKDSEWRVTTSRVRIKTPEAEIMDFADDVSYATSDFFEAYPTNIELQRLLAWEGFEAFVNSAQVKLAKDLKKQDLELILPETFRGQSVRETLSLKNLREGRVDLDALRFIYLLVFVKAGFTSERPSSTPFIQAMSVENALKEILMSPKIYLPADTFYVPRSTRDLADAFDRIRDSDEVWEDHTFQIVDPYLDTKSAVIAGIEIYRTAKVGSVAKVLLCLLKEAVVRYVHMRGDQRARHLVRGLRCGVLLQTFVTDWPALMEDIIRLAKTIFTDASVRGITYEIARLGISAPSHTSSSGDSDGEHQATLDESSKLKWRFCCDILASQSEMAAENLFYKYCTLTQPDTKIRVFSDKAKDAFKNLVNDQCLTEFFPKVSLDDGKEGLVDLLSLIVLNWPYTIEDEEIASKWHEFRDLVRGPQQSDDQEN